MGPNRLFDGLDFCRTPSGAATHGLFWKMENQIKNETDTTKIFRSLSLGIMEDQVEHHVENETGCVVMLGLQRRCQSYSFHKILYLSADHGLNLYEGQGL